MASIDMDINRLVAQLQSDEGLRLKPYRCTAGKLTIGYGRNLEDRGITAEEANHLLMNDISRVIYELSWRLPCWGRLDDLRRRALANMAFQLGIDGLLGFRKMIAALEAGDYEGAAAQALDSLWARQTPARAQRVAAMIGGDAP